jgi:hypothetical protein
LNSLAKHVRDVHVAYSLMSWPCRQVKAGAKSSGGASGAWHLLVEALRAEATEAAEAAQASQASQALPQATWAPGDGDEVDTEKSNSASHQEL